MRTKEASNPIRTKRRQKGGAWVKNGGYINMIAILESGLS